MSTVPPAELMPRAQDRSLDWILDDMLQIPGGRHAVLLSNDGLVLAHANIDRDPADLLAAAVCGLRALSRQAIDLGVATGSPWEQTLLESGDGYLLICDGGDNTVLVAAAGLEVDLHVLWTRMQDTVQRRGEAVLRIQQRGHVT